MEPDLPAASWLFEPGDACRPKALNKGHNMRSAIRLIIQRYQKSEYIREDVAFTLLRWLRHPLHVRSPA